LTAPGNEGKQGEVPRALDGDGEGALALRGESRLAARFDLAALGDEAAQAGDILVIDLVHAIGCEDVHAAPATRAGTTEAPAATTTKPATAATTKPATATAAKPAAAAITIAATILGTRRAIIAGRALARCAGGALLINHESFLLQSLTALLRT
jgi:hypothetical protein